MGKCNSRPKVLAEQHHLHRRPGLQFFDSVTHVDLTHKMAAEKRTYDGPTYRTTDRDDENKAGRRRDRVPRLLDEEPGDVVRRRPEVLDLPPRLKRMMDNEYIQKMASREYETLLIFRCVNAARKRQGWQATADLPEFMWRLCKADRESLIKNDVSRMSWVDLTDKQQIVVDDITRPIATALYNDSSDQTQPSEFYWYQAQESIFCANNP
jgi:hypothetical protein